MYYVSPPYLSRIFNVLLIGGLFLLLSCQSDPIVLNPPGGYEYYKQSFPLNTAASHSIQGDAHTGYSPRLYSGILTSGEIVSALIRLLPQVLDTHQVCSADSISKVNISLTSITQLAEEDTSLLIQKDAIQIHLISLNEIWDEDAVFDTTKLSIISSALDTAPTLSNTVIEIKSQSIDIKLFDYDSNIIQRWCETQEELGIVVSYTPNDDETIKFIEFYSSDGSSSEPKPRLSLEYAVKEETSINYNHYSLNDVFWSDGLLPANVNGPYYVEKTISDNWDMIYIYAFNLKENSPSPSPEMQLYDSLLFQDDIITNENLNTDLSLLQIKLELNSEIEEMDSITISLINVFVFISDIDPSGDNWNADTNPDSTENNLTYDEGEVFYDYGTDNCTDELEDGIGGCVLSEEGIIFNSEGTETNGQLDWVDENGNDLWDEGEGEMWWDWGSDWCPDSLENGDGFCIADTSSCNCLNSPDITLGYDPNMDNADSEGDDWHEINNPDGTEGNQMWDSGEPFYDWGLDGLPMALAGDPDEFEGNGLLEWTDKNNNGAWDQGEGERWFDTGTDGKYNENEVENYENHTEGNFIFNTGERYLDCGEGENQFGLDLNCVEDSGDDYNIDPNSDNWNSVDFTGTQGNGIHNWTDNNDNGKWDENEGEEWFDWGLDGVQDTLEAFQVSSVIAPNLYDNSYIFYMSEGEFQVSPDLVADTVSIWISEIQKTDNLLTIQVGIQTNVALKGLQFQLFHTPYSKIDTIPRTYQSTISSIDKYKLFEDFTMLPKKNYSDEELEEKLMVDYTNDVYTFFDFDNLNLFLAKDEYIFSHEYSNLVFYLNTDSSYIHNGGMYIDLIHTNSSGEDEILKSEIVSSLSDSVEIQIGQILRRYQNGSIGTFNGLKLKTSGNLYNYSKLSIKNNLRIDVMYSQ